MALYANENFTENGERNLVVEDKDTYFQNILSELGFVATESKESIAIFDIHADKMGYTLPDGFSVTSMADTYDVLKYGQVLWRGFNHEANGEDIFASKILENVEIDVKRPNVDLNLKIAAVAPNDDFVSYCGMWCDALSQSALVEPVATDPNYRKMGLGKAVVFEAIKRCGLVGAKKAFVGSTQQFYYNIGFKPYSTATRWHEK